MTGPPATTSPASPVPPAPATPPHDASQEARRVRFSERYPGVHFSSPLAGPADERRASWIDAHGSREQARKPTLEQLLDELENRFGLGAPHPRAGPRHRDSARRPREGTRPRLPYRQHGRHGKGNPARSQGSRTRPRRPSPHYQGGGASHPSRAKGGVTVGT